jgi:hypothetical protein
MNHLWISKGTRRLFRLTLTATVVASVAIAALAAGSASALSGKAINIGTPYDSGQPAVAVDGSGNAYIAWANTDDLAGASNFVQYCVIAPGGTGCKYSGNLYPADSAAYVDGVQVQIDGSTIVILADVYGAAGEDAGDYAPEQEWQSTDGGASFSIVDGGLSVADGILSADTGPIGAVVLPGGDLGYGWDSAASFLPGGGAPPSFNAFPLTSPGECSTEKCDGAAVNNEALPLPFAILQPDTDQDQVSNVSGAFVAQQGTATAPPLPAAPTGGVLGIFNTLFSNGNLGCSGSDNFGLDYVYGTGAQSATNNYNLSPGTADSAWKVPVTLADCGVEYPAAAGGVSGFGVLEDNENNATVDYHAFDPTTEKFDTPRVTVLSGHGEEDSALSQDGSGDIYGTYLWGGEGGPLELSYSPIIPGIDGHAGAPAGTAWSSAPLQSDTGGDVSDPTSAVGSDGQGWAVWTDNGSVFAQQFDAADAIVPSEVEAATSSSATSTGSTVSVTVSCSSPCTVTITIDVPQASSASVSLKSKKAKLLKLSSGKFSLKAGVKTDLKLKLDKAGEKLFALDHDKLKASLLVDTKNAFGKFSVTRKLKITKPTKKTKK